ncbi:MAG: hypothetical protein QOF62_1942 [Pyrinomonadaceae bacterium]|jgi:hypothetical protein|nr:hypothetical protein [Pyrinomonadaceae bacterium]
MELCVMSRFKIDLRHLPEDTTQDMLVEVYVG